MLRDLRTILNIVLVLVPICLLIGYLTTTEEEAGIVIHPTFLKDSSPRTQSERERTWREYEFESVSVIDSSQVRYPALMQVDNIGNICVLDWDVLRVKLFSPTATPLGMTGHSESGSSFANPTGLTVDRRNAIWVCDPRKGHVARFDAGGDLVQTIVPKFLVYKIAVIEDRMITLSATVKSTLIDIYDLSGNWLKSLGTFIENQQEYGMSLDGYIVGDDEGQGFIYGGRHVGILAGYDIDGKQRFIARTIDRWPLPEILVNGDRRQVLARDRIAISSMSISDDNLYLLRGIPSSSSEEGAGQVVDVHDKRNGEYLYSFTIPKTCEQAIFQSDRMYTRGDNGVTVWHVKSPDG